MGASSRRWTTFSASALLLAAGGGVMLAVCEPPHPSIRMEDGTRVTLLAVTDDTEPSVVGSPLQRFLHTVLPHELKDRSGATVLYHHQALGRWYWVEWEGGNLDNFSATAFDEFGNESSATTGSSGWGGNLTTFQFWQSYPRRGRLAGLRIYRDRSESQKTSAPRNDAWYPVGELSTASPSPPVETRWQAAELPVSAQAGDVEAILTRLEVGTPSRPGEPAEAPGVALGRATVHLKQHGLPTVGWLLQPEAFTDATGNRWGAYTLEIERQNATTHILFSSPSWPREEVWRLTLALVRTEDAVFRPEETWTLNDLPVPRPGQVLRLSRKKTLLNVRRELVGIYGPGTKLPSGASTLVTSTVKAGRCALVFRVHATQPHTSAIALSARSNSGHPLQFGYHGTVFEASNPDRMHEVFEAEPFPKSKRMSVTLAVQQVRYVELTARRNLITRGSGTGH